MSVDDDPDYLREYEHLTQVRLLLARHRVEQHAAAQHSVPESSASPAAAALGLLDRLYAAVADAGRDGSLLEIRVSAGSLPPRPRRPRAGTVRTESSPS